MGEVTLVAWQDTPQYYRRDWFGRWMRCRAVGLRSFSRDCTAASAVEFALIFPVLAMLLLGIIYFGIAMNNYIELTNAASTGSRQLVVGRGATTPYSSTITAIQNGAPNLDSSSITSTLTVGGVSCTSDNAACQAAFGNGSTAVQATVSLTYPCTLTLFVLTVANCRLASSASGQVQ
jgi:Flp pilus assembly protein TadG